MIAGTYKSDNLIKSNGIDKVHSNCDCIKGTIVNGFREPIWYSFVLDKPPGHKIYNEPGIKPFIKINKSAFSHNILYLEDDEHKLVDFNGGTISFICQLVKKNYIFK